MENILNIIFIYFFFLIFLGKISVITFYVRKTELFQIYGKGIFSKAAGYYFVAAKN